MKAVSTQVYILFIKKRNDYHANHRHDNHQPLRHHDNNHNWAGEIVLV